jgi:uncharacterized protein
MLLTISPAKSLDYATPIPDVVAHTQPELLEHSARLIQVLRDKSLAEVAQLMGISDQLAALNVVRYAEWSLPFDRDNSRQAVFAFNGDVYEGLDVRSLSNTQLAFAQEHLRILSGLYGVLRPLDLIQAYRLEMGTRLANSRGKDLYAFWGEQITNALNAVLARQSGAPVLVNLASEEYFKSVRVARIGGRIVTPVFEERKGNTYKIVSFYAKRARGLMCRYAFVNKIDQVEALKGFDLEGYSYEAEVSQENRWVFRRSQM